VNAKVWSYAQEHPEASGMGNTLTVMLVRGNHALIGHIGDSRLYRLRDHAMTQISSDHTLVAEQVRAGKLSPEAARVHPTRHILSRAIGSRQFVVPDIFETDLRVGDVYMMCSDGVSGMINDQKIRDILDGCSPTLAAKRLVEAANAAGGKDNATAVVLYFDQLPVVFPAKFSFSRLALLFQNFRNAGSV
jgi:protein phosphatase